MEHNTMSTELLQVIATLEQTIATKEARIQQLQQEHQAEAENLATEIEKTWYFNNIIQDSINRIRDAISVDTPST